MFNIIEQIIANHFGITHEGLLTDRGRDASDARHFLWYILHCIMGYSGQSVARQYGTSARNVMHYSSLIKDGIRSQPFYAKHYRELRSVLKTLDII